MNDKIIVIFLSVVILGLCLFITTVNCQLVISEKGVNDYKFVVGKTGKFCYVESEAPKNLVILAKFDTFSECHQFVTNYLSYSR